MSLLQRFRELARDGVDPAADLVIREGTMREYDGLAGLHYRAGRPATCARVLVAEGHGGIAAVLVVSMPTLNGRWRGEAWADLLRGDNRERARRLNDSVRTISRVIVEPRWRGLGIATRLVREYLVRPLTERTEAVAAMGAACPFFARAGMREWRMAPDRRGMRLLTALRAEGMEAWELVGTRRVPRELERALRIWADGARATRGLARGAVAGLCRAAAAVGTTVAYTCETAAAEAHQTRQRACPHSGQAVACGKDAKEYEQ